jgi:hypothetical protein
MSNKMMTALYDVDVRTISDHLNNVFPDSELEEHSLVQYCWITATDGKAYDIQHYSLAAPMTRQCPNHDS